MALSEPHPQHTLHCQGGDGAGPGCLPGGTVLGCAGISIRAFPSLRRRGHVAVTLDGLRSLQPLMAHTHGRVLEWPTPGLECHDCFIKN